MAENVEAPAPGGAKKANEVVKAAVQSTEKYAGIAMKELRKGSRIFSETVGEAREQAPLLKRRALEILDKLQNLEAFQLRHHQDAQKFGVFSRDLSQAYDAASLDLKALSVPAVGGVAVIALRLLAAIDACINQILIEAFYTKTFISRATLVAMAVPGYVAAALYMRKLGRLPQEVEPLDLAAGARCLPPAFWVMAVSSGAVTIKALTEIANGIVRRVFSIRLRTLILAAAISGGLQHPAVRQRFLEVSHRIPPNLLQNIEDLWFKFQSGTRALARKIGPLLESVFEKAETTLMLKKVSLPRASIVEIPKDLNAGDVGNLEFLDPKDLNAGDVGNLEFVDAPLFTGPTGETEVTN